MTTALQPVAKRPSLIGVGTGLWLASELLFFGGLFAVYFQLRQLTEVWPPPDVELEIGLSGLATLVLIGSSVTIHLADLAERRGHNPVAQRWMAVTILLGAVFLANQAREYLTLDFTLSTHAYGSIFYLLTGFHGLHVLGGLVLLSVVWARLASRRRADNRGEVLEAASYYWHFVDVVWIVLFVVVYVIQ